MAAIGVTSKVKTSNRHYCCVCSNFGGLLVNDKVISLHRFPADKSVQASWLHRVRIVSRNFKLNRKNDRLCSAHFDNGVFVKGAIPTTFILQGGNVKKFSSTKIEPVTSKRDECCTTCTDKHPDDKCVSGNIHLTQPSDFTSENMSLMFNDYCANVNQAPFKTLNKCEQTDVTVCTVGTQTEVHEFKFATATTQTETADSQDIGIQVERPDITYEDVTQSDEKCMFYTGIPKVKIFDLLFDEMDDAVEHTNRKGDGINTGRPRTLRLVDEFVLVMMRLRLGLLLEDLSYRFKISVSTCSSITNQWICYLSQKLAFLIHWPSKSAIIDSMPQKFKRVHPDCRVVIDCTEIFTETPQSNINKSLLYSHYKSHMTYKALIGISPAGNVTFTSDLWTGSISDKQLTEKCQILDLCEPGDAIMADKGFLITDLTAPRCIKLIIPPLKRNRQLDRRQVEVTRRIANLRIDVERAIARIKKFRILHGVLPITIAHLATHVWKICVSLTNLQPPLTFDEDD